MEESQDQTFSAAENMCSNRVDAAGMHIKDFKIGAALCNFHAGHMMRRDRDDGRDSLKKK